MTPILIALATLMLFMVVASLIAVETKDLLSSVVSVGAAGFGLAIVDLLLQAPDLAITQMVVEILCVVVLIRVIVTRADTTHETPRDSLTVGAVVLCLGLLLAASYGALKHLHPFGQPRFGQGGGMADGYVAQGLSATNAANYVMAVLLDFRAYDTLGEATVIFVSIVGAYAILRKVGRIGHVADK
ncbi:MAG: hydrogen gas-evolving membrane-bound hydrogenase subunit E [Gemmatimonadota bacterium]